MRVIHPPPHAPPPHQPVQMKTFLFALALLLAAFPAAAQKSPGVRPDSSGVYELRDVQVLPRPINTARLQAALASTYPASLSDAPVSGTVEVRMRVDEKGVPRDLKVMQSTHADFDAPTLAAVANLRFVPAQVDGRPVQVWVILPIQWEVAPAESQDR